MVRVIIMALLVVVLAVGGQTLLKHGVTQVGGVSFSQGHILEGVRKVLSKPYILAGFALYGLAAIFWLDVLSKLPLSSAYPIMALTYGLAVASGYFFFGELVTPAKIAGVILISLGVIVIGRG